MVDGRFRVVVWLASVVAGWALAAAAQDAPAPPAAKADPDTLLLLHLDEGRGNKAADSSGNGHDGFIHKAKWAEGRFGKALEFDGQDAYVEVGRCEKLDFGKDRDFTVECWVQVRPDTPPGFYFILTSRVRMDMPGYTLMLHRNMHAMAALGDKVNQVGGLVGKKPINDGQWHHVALTAERKGKASLYVDGDLQASADISHIVTLSDKERPLRIGDRGHDGDFIGRIDEVRIRGGAHTDFALDRPAGPGSSPAPRNE
jgi:hypothetical protein